MAHDIDLATLGRYFAGECSAAERQELERWIASDETRGAEVARLRAAWDHAAEAEPALDVEGAWEAVVRRKAARTLAAEPRRAFVELGGASRPRRWAGAAIAASLVLATSTAAWLALRAGERAATPTAEAPMRVARTAARQTADVYLADGTHVRLGASSTLRFPTAFGTARDVQLEGEAYFDVAHDERKPFAVHTARAVARDIGTRFTVRAYHDAPNTEVVVAEGAVALAAGGDSVLLRPADLGRLDAAGRLTRTSGVDVEAELGWMTGRLVFTDAPLRDALPRLSRWYGIDFVVGDSALAGAHLTTTLGLESLPDALRRLSAVLDARIERRDSAVVLHPNRRLR